MNNEEITNLLNPYLQSHTTGIQCDVSGATTNLQLASIEDICFYNINDDDKSMEVFKDRLLKSSTRNIVVTRNVKLENINVWVVDKENYLTSQKLVANKIYPSKNKLKLIGITGTNGKTTCSFLAMQLATTCGMKSLSVGTIGVRSTVGIIEKDLLSTTPSYLELKKLIFTYQDLYQAMFIEISSHALAQNRLFDIELDVCGWTSFSQDHLDYHKDLDDYFDSKAKIIINSNYKSILIPSTETDLKNKLKSRNIEMQLVEPYYNKNLSIGFKASYNQSNLGLAKGLVEIIINREVLEKEISNVTLPDGRFEPLEFGENIVIIDYAHTPDALENVCHTIRTDFKDYYLIVVFGCGGDRDRSKRPLMGSAVSQFADQIIVTSDNPRKENPQQIIEDTIKGISKNYLTEVDRKKAMLLALESTQGKSVILIAGKGHEDYQEIDGVKYDFSDSETIKELIKGK